MMPPAHTTGPAHLYARHAAAADAGAWSVERDVRWSDIDRAVARSQPELLRSLRDAALIESFHPINLMRLVRLTWDDVDAGVAFSLEMYEGFKHFHVLRRYLETVAPDLPLTDDDIVASRRPGMTAERVPETGDLIEQLVNFMLSEHLASYFFRRLASQARDPVLAELLEWIAADEVRHAQSASDLIAKRIARDATVIPRVLEAATAFRHFGEEVVGAVPVAEAGDSVAIRTFAARIERLCDIRLVDHLKTRL